jgi:hypothetical protein
MDKYKNEMILRAWRNQPTHKRVLYARLRKFDMGYAYYFSPFTGNLLFHRRKEQS